ncbi:MAG: aminotransferase class V-fold PLP-dependent enzyme [Clostridiales bacterium]|nr:aminotransferase class V-fold PLP-dependent enzyme [Clostridiales bacterium]
MKKYLDELLMEYGCSDIYPFHMPGHKRQCLGEFRPEEIDITEIDGFDNLHHAGGILKEGQERLASLFGSDESFYLINGSTAGILAAICGCMKKGGRLLIGRNCHQSVYHAACLMEARVAYLYPEPTDFGIQGSIVPEEAERKLREFPDAQAVVITSPTYDGVVSDIETIAEIVHAHGIPLIVDAAHGAHFGFSKGFPQKAIALGADLSVESLHKTLPCYTQTAVLHMRKAVDGRWMNTDGCLKEQNNQDSPAAGDEMYPAKGYRFDPERVKGYLEIFQSSSPSYVLMAGIDRCVRMLEEDLCKYRQPKQRQGSLFGMFENRLRQFYKKCGEFRHVKVLPGCSGGIYGRDYSKILISAETAGLNGQQLYNLLLDKYHLQMEMASGHYVTAITTIMDTEEGFCRLFTALREIDEGTKACREFIANDSSPDRKKALPEGGGAAGCSDENSDAAAARELTPVKLYRPQLKCLEIAQATDAEKRVLPLPESANRIAGEFIYLYPPGIPVIVPGEIITKETLELIEVCCSRGMQVQGTFFACGTDKPTIRVLKQYKAV